MAKIVRPRPIAPGARILRLHFDDGEVWELDAVDHLLRVNEQNVKWARHLKEMQLSIAEAEKARRTSIAEATNARRKEHNEFRDLLIWTDVYDLMVLAISDRPRLERMLAETYTLRDHKIVVPMAKRRSFKPENAFAAIARKYGVSIPTVKAIFPPLESKGGNEKSK